MASRGRSKRAAIAPGPPSINPSENGGPARMGYACQTCTKRKVKCDKTMPTCASCGKADLECIYEPPRSRNRKRKLSEDVVEKLARYENILRQHGLLDSDTNGQSPPEDTRESRRPIMVKVIDDQLKYCDHDSGLWKPLEELRTEDETDEEDVTPIGDPLTGALVGSTEVNLRRYHPTPTIAWLLWETYMENVEPLCKMLHTPTTSALMRRISQELVVPYRSHECLVFSIYHFAVFSMSERDCYSKLGQSRDTLLDEYHYATKQALINAHFLRTTQLSVLQALVLLLLASQGHYDARTYWALTGVAVRTAQRIGIHQDGEEIGLPPFEVEMRRRLFYQLMPLDARASQMVGAEISILPDEWDTRPPLNINDDQIWPEMTNAPEERDGATEMMFCRFRASLDEHMYSVKADMSGGGRVLVPGRSIGYGVAEKAVEHAESEVEEKYIRYCDAINPLHFLAICMARAGTTVMRLRIRLPKTTRQMNDKSNAREVLPLALRILDTDAAVCSHASLERYHWHTETFFLWGTWASFIFVLTHLWKNEAVSRDVDAIWKRVEAMYRHHEDLLESKRSLYVALRRLTLKAWEVHPSKEMKEGVDDPGFITALRPAPDTASPGPENRNNENSRHTTHSASISPSQTSPGPPQSEMLGGMSLDAEPDFDIDGANWASWDRLIQNHEARNDEWG
ncbi:fungal-specific transcription factor domain-containing protein [Chaetomium tenue]|uniref:Fungal-specific transcription factor domain-containing protein n=1 Tax=Chaetomium tenue TaxID=1854479 RepID=A0ACB7PK62_9PEZI|nr:fungal-specific transcription factor domain-containing protein [Chaetomium globosum]